LKIKVVDPKTVVQPYMQQKDLTFLSLSRAQQA
jgi:hypothetical protein